jgi:RimJ/RimL family protein N-acetyltransferase
VGCCLRREAWGHGYATEAATALRFGFEQFGLQRTVSLTSTSNAASQKVMQRIGMARRTDGSPLKRHVVWVAERGTGQPAGTG